MDIFHIEKYDIVMEVLKLIVILTKAQLKSRYRKTLAGFFWVLMNPIITFLIQALLFKNILKIEIDKYYTFLLAGIIPWIFMANSWSMSVNMFISQRSTFLAFKLHPAVILSTQILDNLINYFASYLILFILVDFYTIINPKYFILFLIYTLGAVFFVTITSFFISMINVIFRDTQFVIQFVLNLAYFITPIFYPFSLLPESLKKYVVFNPIYYLVKPFQDLFWRQDVFTSLKSFLILILISLGFFVLTALFWKKNKNELFYKF